MIPWKLSFSSSYLFFPGQMRFLFLLFVCFLSRFYEFCMLNRSIRPSIACMRSFRASIFFSMTVFETMT